MKVLLSQQVRPQQHLIFMATKANALKVQQNQDRAFLGASHALPGVQQIAPSQQSHQHHYPQAVDLF